jgi:hypothetical protein
MKKARPSRLPRSHRQWRTYGSAHGRHAAGNPNRLREAADAQRNVGNFVAWMDTGQSVTNAATGMLGLQTADACHFVGTESDATANTVHDELMTHSEKLAAADQYHRTDDGDLAARLDAFKSHPMMTARIPVEGARREYAS